MSFEMIKASENNSEMIKAIEETIQQYIDRRAEEACPLCIYARKHAKRTDNMATLCQRCPWMIFEGIKCKTWLWKVYRQYAVKDELSFSTLIKRNTYFEIKEKRFQLAEKWIKELQEEEE